MDNCKFCHRPITKAVLAKKRQIRADNAREGLREAKARGKHIGRPITRDDLMIKQLRAEGLSYRQIGKKLGISADTALRGSKA